MSQFKKSVSRFNTSDVRTIHGYPDALKLIRMHASKYWYVRMYIKGGPSSGVKKSTRCEKFSDAVEFAKDWYETKLLEKRSHRLRGKESFEVFAAKFSETQKREVRRGDLSEKQQSNDTNKLKNDVLPAFGDIHISKIDYTLVDQFIDELKQERGLSASTMKKYVVLIRKVLNEAERDRVIPHVPSLPTISRVDNPRPWFNPEEYRQLLSGCRDLRDNPPKDISFDFGELYDFIIFMVHSFLRPSEWKFLQNKHIRKLDEDGVTQLVITVPNSKTSKSKGNLDTTTTEIAADIYYNRILKRHDDRNDFLFFNEIRDRESYVSDRVSRMFSLLCDHAGLVEDSYGQKHTMYSLRHSALCFQILKTGGTDLFGLAQNARTSTEMLEKFYLSHLTPQMPVFARQLRTTRVLEDSN